MKPPPDPRYRHRFPAEIISHAVWLYHVFALKTHIGRHGDENGRCSVLSRHAKRKTS
jgi:hypothetical protein